MLTFTTLDPRRPAVSFSVVTDTHEDVARIRALDKVVDWKTTEFLVHSATRFTGSTPRISCFDSG